MSWHFLIHEGNTAPINTMEVAQAVTVVKYIPARPISAGRIRVTRIRAASWTTAAIRGTIVLPRAWMPWRRVYMGYMMRRPRLMTISSSQAVWSASGSTNRDRICLPTENIASASAAAMIRETAQALPAESDRTS